MIKTKLLVAAFLGGFFVPTFAADPSEPPEGMYQQTVPILLNCFNSFARMVEVLGDTWGETPMMLSQMNERTTIVLFSGPSAENFSTSTLVVTRLTRTGEEACVMWSGASNQMSFSLNLNPVFPAIKVGT
tara:strand:- start:173 stop:562 length:390 start_codon:yes stop_codon:yes gene_type:complete